MKRFVCCLVAVGCMFVASGGARAEEQDVVQAKHERTAMNSINLELGGNALLYSLNYERFLGDEMSVRVGAMFMSVSATASSGTSTASANVSWFSAPLTMSYLGIGSPNHKLELGAGAVLMYLSANGSTFDWSGSAKGFLVAPTAIVGYRYVPTDGGFNFRAGFTPLFISAGGKSTFLPWAGIAAGYGF